MRKKTSFTGVFERESSERVHKRKPDIAYDICYRHEGRLIWEKVGWLSEGYSPKLASDIRSERMRSKRHGLELPQDKPKTLFKAAAKKYIEWAKTNKVKEGRDDRLMIERHLAPRFENHRLDTITSFDLERMKSEMLKADYAPATVKHALVVMRQIYNKAIAWKVYRGENPVKSVKMPKIANQRERFLSRDEAEALLKALKVKSVQVHDMALLSLHSGMRFGEIAALRVHDIDMVNGLITIRDPKNREPRKAYMTSAVKAMFRDRITEAAKPNDLIFPDENGKQQALISRTFPRVVDALKLNEGIKDRRQQVCFHTLRNTFASWLALQGEQIQTISELLGHKTLQMTIRYSHLTPDHRKAAVNRLEDSLNNIHEEVHNGMER